MWDAALGPLEPWSRDVRDSVSSPSSVVPLVQMGETDANVAKFLNRYSEGVGRVSGP